MKKAISTPKVSIWLVEDHEDFRKMVAWQINEIEGLHCPHHFSNCEEMLAALEREVSRPQVVLFDIGLPGMDGISGIQKMKALSPQTHVIVLTVYDDHAKVFSAICAGASGYLLKPSSSENLANAIHEVMNGGAPMNPRVAKMVLDRFTKQNAITPRSDHRLTAREMEIVELMVKGFIKKEIADKLGVSYNTVNNQVRSIYEKLHVHTRGGAVAKVLEERLFSLA
jgi:DNA-binding NarL/FixJ family response regulator